MLKTGTVSEFFVFSISPNRSKYDYILAKGFLKMKMFILRGFHAEPGGVFNFSKRFKSVQNWEEILES